jgi:serine/threonine-protein kinase
MPIVGVIAPTKTTGPIILTPYSAAGSLEDVLERVRLNDAPHFWNDCGKLRMIVSLVSGLHYLHRRGIVHRELKPTDLIVEDDGSIRICGYATSVLEEHRFIRASQVGGPSYMAPEIYDDEHIVAKVRDPKTDVFSFGLILFEIVCGHRVFPSNMSTAVIMRRVMSARPGDRAVIPSSVGPVIRDLILRSWVPLAQKRPTIEALWKQMRDAGFKLFPSVDVRLIAADSESKARDTSQGTARKQH